MVTLVQDLRSFPRVACCLRDLSQCLRHLIGLFGLVRFPNLVFIKLNVRTLSAKETYGSYMFQPPCEFLPVANMECESFYGDLF